MAIKSVMSEKGSIYVQLDQKIGHYVKILMDEIFGEDNFQNDITWEYQGSWVEPKNHFPKRHQDIFFYRLGDTEGEEPIYNRDYENDVQAGINYSRWYDYIENNKIYAKNAPFHDKRFKPYVERFKKEYGREPKGDDILMDFKGSVVGDVWYIKAADPKSPQYTGYATQKPESLLERVIRASSNEGMVFWRLRGYSKSCK